MIILSLLQVDEINQVVTNELTPQLEKLKKERAAYMQWTAATTEIERLTRFVTACQFVECEQILKK